MNLERQRDITIEAGIHALLKTKEPGECLYDILKRTETNCIEGSGFYTILLDGKPLCRVYLTGIDSYKLDILMPWSNAEKDEPRKKMNVGMVGGTQDPDDFPKTIIERI